MLYKPPFLNCTFWKETHQKWLLPTKNSFKMCWKIIAYFNFTRSISGHVFQAWWVYCLSLHFICETCHRCWHDAGSHQMNQPICHSKGSFRCMLLFFFGTWLECNDGRSDVAGLTDVRITAFWHFTAPLSKPLTCRSHLQFSECKKANRGLLGATEIIGSLRGFHPLNANQNPWKRRP